MKIPSPPVNPESKAFFDAAREGKLLLAECSACKALHYYPRAVCPFCASEKIQWVEAKGKGTAGKGAVIDQVSRRFPTWTTEGDDNAADVLRKHITCSRRPWTAIQPASGTVP